IHRPYPPHIYPRSLHDALPISPAATTEVVACARGQGQGDRGATGDHSAAAPHLYSVHRELLRVLSVSKFSGAEMHLWRYLGPVVRSSPTAVWDSLRSLLVRPGPCRDVPARAPSTCGPSPLTLNASAYVSSAQVVLADSAVTIRSRLSRST